MKTLIALLNEQNGTLINKFKADILALNSAEDIANKANRMYKNVLTKAKKVKLFNNIEALKSHVIERYQTIKTNELNTVISSHGAFSELGKRKISKIVITVEWKKSATWGANPTAEAEIWSTNESNEPLYNHYQGSSIGGCGYDKKSTAVAEVLNYCPEVLGALAQYKEKHFSIDFKSNRDLLGYGSGYGILPQIEGGVGVDCYNTIFEKIGLKFEQTASGKTFDVFTITKI